MITYGSTTLTSYNTITKIEVYYYKSTSATSLSGGSWSTTKPTWENGKYIWQKIRTTYEGKLENGLYYSESDPVNITGQQGEAGSSAYSYKLNASDTIVSISKNGTYSTNTIIFSATSKQGTDDIEPYLGRFKIETTLDGITWNTNYTSNTNESSMTFTIPENITNIRCSLYQTGGMTVLLDIVSVSIVRDGTDATGLKDSIPFYLASDKETGITIYDEGWSTLRPALDSTKKYLWVYYLSRYSDGVTDPEIIEVSKNIAVFENNGDISPIYNTNIEIEAGQKGYGDPSPTNIKNIFGYTNIKLTTTGENKAPNIDTTASWNHNTGTRTYMGQNFTEASTDLIRVDFNENPNYVYSSNVDSVNCMFLAWDKDLNYIGRTSGALRTSDYVLKPSNFAASLTGNTNDIAYVAVKYYKATGQDINNVVGKYCQIESGKTSTDYESYQGKTYNISLPSEAGTVYGGTLLINENGEGELVVNKVKISLRSAAAWKKSTTYLGSFYISYVNFNTVYGVTLKNRSSLLCSHAKQVTDIADYIYGTCYTVGSININIMDESATLEDWNAYLEAQYNANTPVQICGELETPITYTLTTNQILMLQGENNIYADTGKITIDYYDNQKTTEPHIDYSATSAFEYSAEALDKIDNLEIGGRNLLRMSSMSNQDASVSNQDTDFTKYFRRYNGTASQHTFEKVTDGVYQDTIALNTSGNLGIAFVRAVSEFNLDVESEYTLSCWAKTTKANSHLDIGLSYYKNSNSWVWRGGTNPQYFEEINKWQFFQLTFKPDADTQAICYCFTMVGEANGTNNFTIRNCKLEKGNRATDWSPAPEDTDANIQQIQDNLDNLEIGGRNILLNSATNFPRVYASAVLSTENNINIPEFKCSDGLRCYGHSGTNTTCLLINYQSHGLAVYANASINKQPYVFSIYIKNNHATNAITVKSNFSGNVRQRVEPNEAVRAVINSIGNGVSVIQFNFLTDEIGDDFDFSFWHPQIELGNKVTDWKPAIEDIEAEVSALKDNLQSQIDEKIQTYYQSTNPASSWTTTELRTPHDGDLWYYTGATTSTYIKDNVYRYNASNNTWSVYAASGELFDKVDGKSTIYYGTTSDIYTGVETGDYLVDSTDGSSYRWDGSTWIKVTDYQTTITNAIDAVEIGGRNLILGTDAITETTKSRASTDSSTYADVYSKTITRILGVTEYVVSFEAKADSNRTIKCYWYSPNTTTYAESSTGQTSTGADGGCEVSVTSEWKRYWVRWKQSDQANTNKNLIVGRLTRPEEGTATLSIRAVKFETGNKATNWSPAPEDTDASIQQVQNNLDNLEIGGRNLLLSTATFQNWGIGTSTVINNNYAIITGSSSNWSGLLNTQKLDLFLMDGTTNYIFAFDYKSAVEIKCHIVIAGTNVQSNESGYSRTKYTNWDSYQLVLPNTNGIWKRYVLPTRTIAVSDLTLGSGDVNSWFLQLYNRTDDDIYIKNWKLEKGNKATDWTPAPEDTQAEIDTALAQSIWYATCADAGATKTATISPETTNFTLNVGTTVNVQFSNTNTGAVGELTLNINETGAKNIKYINNNTIASIPSAGYILGGRTYLFVYDGTYWVIQNLNYNTDTMDNRITYFSGKTGSIGIWNASLFMRDGDGNYQNICTASDGTCTGSGSTSNRTVEPTKKANPNGFEVGSPIWYCTTAYNPNTNISGANVVYSANGQRLESRYSFNTTLTAGSLTAYKPIFLVGTINELDGLFYLDTVWWTQTPTDSTKVYVLVGHCYDSTTSACRFILYEQNNWYKYDDGILVDYSNSLAELAATTATSFIAVETDNNGIMVHPENDMATGWQIGSAINLFKDSLSYIKLWIENTIAKIRIGNEDKNHIIIDDEAIRINGEKNDEIKELAKYSAEGISFDNETPYRIGNDTSYISFENTANNTMALNIVADNISFTDSPSLQEQITDLQNGFDSIQNNNYIRITPSEPSITIATDATNVSGTSLKLTSDKLSFMSGNEQVTAYMANDQLYIPTASINNLFMQSANETYEKVWVMRSNGHLSLKTIKRG